MAERPRRVGAATSDAERLSRLLGEDHSGASMAVRQRARPRLYGNDASTTAQRQRVHRRAAHDGKEVWMDGDKVNWHGKVVRMPVPLQIASENFMADPIHNQILAAVIPSASSGSGQFSDLEHLFVLSLMLCTPCKGFSTDLPIFLGGSSEGWYEKVVSVLLFGLSFRIFHKIYCPKTVLALQLSGQGMIKLGDDCSVRFVIMDKPVATSNIIHNEKLLYKNRGLQSCFMKGSPSSPWPDLRPELLGLVLKWLPSLPDRIRLRAVCRPWRSNGRLQHLPPPLPWLTLLDGTFLSVPDGKIIPMPVPDNASCCGSIDSWLFLMQSDGGCSLVNPFTKAKVDLPNLALVWHRKSLNAARSEYVPRCYKLAVPSPLDSSPDSHVAALIEDSGNSSTVCICQPPIATDVYTGSAVEPPHFLYDVVFFDGKLCGTDFRNRLLIFETSYGLDGEPKFSSVECIINSGSRDKWCLPQPLRKERGHLLRKYLVECCGKLLMVARLIHSSFHVTGHDTTVAFEVFEADLSSKPGRWRCVDNLGGQALFVGKHCSKSFPAGECSGIQEDCIYFMRDYAALWDSAANPLHDSGVYNIRTGMIKPLLLETAAVPQHHGGQGASNMVFPY
ncbi:hypothetical protein EJB05_46260 [Eragrostis curvula]|uniref:KIB1-4 beta-propeller domain-containing protein n=1 Tax=Eragrostis curvula TaxID=38414 RepID=A0A5J9TMH8_9POAL|nr:hypothetical protein EJB05_46260 [Eragrostis curvula]